MGSKLSSTFLVVASLILGYLLGGPNTRTALAQSPEGPVARAAGGNVAVTEEFVIGIDNSSYSTHNAWIVTRQGDVFELSYGSNANYRGNLAEVKAQKTKH